MNPTTPGPTTPQLARQAVLQRWGQLLADRDSLEQALRDAPEGAFTDEERKAAEFALDAVWNLLTNKRPAPADNEG